MVIAAVINRIFFVTNNATFLFHIGSGQPVNGTIPSLPSPTMPTFNMAAQTPNGQPAGTEAVYANGIPQSYAGRKLILKYKHDIRPLESAFVQTTI